VLIGVVFSNLVDNALKYSPEGSTISIRVEIDADEICTVFENEPGAAGRPDPDRAFEKYYRSENAKAQIGSGLGLYVVRGLVELHGGKVTCEPTSKLIRFKVCFPC
jgi:two-component system, sensor histidine kinase LadS